MKAFHAVHVPVPHEFTRSLSFFVYSYPYRILKRNELVLTCFQFHVRLLSSIILYPIHVCILCHCTRGVGSRHTGFSVQPFSTLHVHCTGPGIPHQDETSQATYRAARGCLYKVGELNIRIGS